MQQRMTSLGLIALALALASAPLSAVAQGNQTLESINHWAHSRADLTIYALGINIFPDITVAFADPELEVTTFVPNSMAVQMGMAFFYNLTSPVPLFDAIKIMYRNNPMLYPAAGPDPASALSGKAQNSILWSVIYNHALVLPGAHTIEDLQAGVAYETALPLSQQNETRQTLTLNADKTQVSSLFVQDVPILERNIRIGRSIVHIVRNVLWPSNLPESFTSLSGITSHSRAGDISTFDRILAVASRGLGAINVAQSARPLTVFIPTNAAINTWLTANRLTLQNLLNNRFRCQQFVRHHTVDATPASASGLLLLDLIALSTPLDLDINRLAGGLTPAVFFLPGLDGQPRRTHIENLAGNMLNVTTPRAPRSFTPGPTHVRFGDGPRGQILTIVNFGGTWFINNNVQTVLHKVDTVLFNGF